MRSAAGHQHTLKLHNINASNMTTTSRGIKFTYNKPKSRFAWFWLDLGRRLSGTADCRWRCRQSRCDDRRAADCSEVSTTLWPTAVCSQSSRRLLSRFTTRTDGRRLGQLRSADRRLSVSVSAVHRAVWWQSRSVTQPTLLSHSMYTLLRRRIAAAQLTTLTAITRCRIPLQSHNVRAACMQLVTRARQTATGCAKTHSIYVLSAYSSTL